VGTVAIFKLINTLYLGLVNEWWTARKIQNKITKEWTNKNLIKLYIL